MGFCMTKKHGKFWRISLNINNEASTNNLFLKIAIYNKKPWSADLFIELFPDLWVRGLTELTRWLFFWIKFGVVVIWIVVWKLFLVSWTFLEVWTSDWEIWICFGIIIALSMTNSVLVLGWWCVCFWWNRAMCFLLLELRVKVWGQYGQGEPYYHIPYIITYPSSL